MFLIHRSSLAGLALSLVCLQSARAGDLTVGKAKDGSVFNAFSVQINCSAKLVRELVVRPSSPGDFGQPYKYEFSGEVVLTVHKPLTGVSVGITSKESRLLVSGLPVSWKSGSVNLKPGTYKYPFTMKSVADPKTYTVSVSTTPDFVRHNDIASADFNMYKALGRVKAKK